MAALASWGWQHPGDLRIARGPCPIEVSSEMDFPKIAAAATTSDQHRAHVLLENLDPLGHLGSVILADFRRLGLRRFLRDCFFVGDETIDYANC